MFACPSLAWSNRVNCHAIKSIGAYSAFCCRSNTFPVTHAQLICKLDQRTQRSQWSMVFTGLCHVLRSTKQECEEKMRDEASTQVAIAKITTSCKTSPENVQSQKVAKVIGKARVFQHHMPVAESRTKPAVLKNSCPSLASPNLNEVLAKH